MGKRLNFRDWILLYAEAGETRLKLNLYQKQVNVLISEGYSLQWIGRVPCYPNEGCYRIEWKDAVKGTPAYDMLKVSAQVNPELLHLQNGNVSSKSPLHVHSA